MSRHNQAECSGTARVHGESAMNGVKGMKGYDVFGSAYGCMCRRDPHALCSIDHELMRRMVRLDAQSQAELYAAPGSLPDMRGHELYGLAQQLMGASPRESVRRALDMMSGIALKCDDDIGDMVFGGTERAILARGTDWCADMARVGAVLFMCMGIPARIVHLANLNKAYNGHVVAEAFYDGAWGVCDCIYGYMFYGKRPIGAWELMCEPELMRPLTGDKRFDEYAGLYSAAAISDYDPTDVRNDYTESRANEYTLRLIREGANDGRWFMGEDE